MLAVLTTYDDIGNHVVDGPDDHDFTEIDRDTIVAHLNAAPDNAAIIGNEFDVEYGIVRGGSGADNNFFYGLMPLEDPNDMEGGELTAAEAVSAAMSEMEIELSN